MTVIVAAIIGAGCGAWCGVAYRNWKLRQARLTSELQEEILENIQRELLVEQQKRTSVWIH